MVLSEDHQAALSTLIHSVDHKEGWALLLGNYGEGKTSLLSLVLRNLPQRAIVAVVGDPSLESMDFFKPSGPGNGHGRSLWHPNRVHNSLPAIPDRLPPQWLLAGADR